jgi:hypothetical protein
MVYNKYMSFEDRVVQQGIENDVAYVGRLVRDLSDPKYASSASVISFCMAPYLSLIVHESYRKLQAIDPSLPPLLSSDVESIVARSRHSLKLFEDTHRGVAGQLAYFRDEILPVHTGRFLGNTWLKLARSLETDLGLFSYDQRLIATTHGATFHLGIDPDELFKKGAGRNIQAIYEEYGRYFARLGARLDSSEATFMSQVDPKRFNQHPNDVRAGKYYRRIFDGAGNPDLNALLTVFRGMLNFVNTVMSVGGNVCDTEYTVWKIRFLTVYQILDSLRILHDDRLRPLTARSVQCIEKITGTLEARLIMEPAVKPFRNSLMHYNLHSRINRAKVDIHQPLFGLIPIYFPSYSTATFAEAVDRCIEETAAIMEEWAGA